MRDSDRPQLVLGSNGQVGWELRRTLTPLGSVVAVDREGRVNALADLSDLDRLHLLLDKLNPRIVVNAAGFTDVERAEIEEDFARRINAEAPAVIGQWAAEHKVPVVHYSTDYVYDGSKQEPYTEHDAPNPLNAYGRTKLAGDDALLATGADVVILRANWLYGTRGRNFLRSMQELLTERDEVQVIDDQIGAPVWSRAIAEATGQVIGQILRGQIDIAALRGVYHLASEGATSWHGFAQALCDLGEYDCKVQPVSTADYPSSVNRPLNSRLDCSKAKEQFGISLPDWRSLLLDCLEES